MIDGMTPEDRAHVVSCQLARIERLQHFQPTEHRARIVDRLRRQLDELTRIEQPPAPPTIVDEVGELIELHRAADRIEAEAETYGSLNEYELANETHTVAALTYSTLDPADHKGGLHR